MRELDFCDGKRGIPPCTEICCCTANTNSGQFASGWEWTGLNHQGGLMTHLDHRMKTYEANYSDLRQRTLTDKKVSWRSQPSIHNQAVLSRGERCHRPPSVANAGFGDATSIKMPWTDICPRSMLANTVVVKSFEGYSLLMTGVRWHEKDRLTIPWSSAETKIS
jgi:hypothetical protein